MRRGRIMGSGGRGWLVGGGGEGERGGWATCIQGGDSYGKRVPIGRGKLQGRGTSTTVHVDLCMVIGRREWSPDPC